MSLQDDKFGQDIRLDENMQAMVAANGELYLTDGVDTGCQDIKLRLFTPLGSLFYDNAFGSKVYLWVKDENHLAGRLAFCGEVVRRMRMDPRVVPGSEACSILSWDHTGITAAVSWRFIDVTHAQNLVIEVGTDNMEMVIKDVSTD
ncbi:baseplate assembly protein [Desulfobacter hydrogenophilus]|uniref:Baseplate assembly protein n=1 Tax=Desulfobacter hydrogenophilus TaxID=2291 RepID=A0A328FBD6_9BACT|nr:baseplate assembly protein [Desulfobacter hydrogenophilus]NDY73990.1 baseplate assembly protein [Desulfobacter hydrogenophilus]QBH14335.1 baseplate assembly protein [Desulfobacter hydrogenophilus]RAM00337.1 baseplate assembly protein [Desulfobacter hydrogenophilus]